MAKLSVLAGLALVAATQASIAEELPKDVAHGVELSGITIAAAYSALGYSPEKLLKIHAREIAEAKAAPIVDSKGWAALKQPEACATLWTTVRSDLSRIAGHFQLRDFHSNEQVELAVVESGVALGVTVKVLYAVAARSDASDEDLNALCSALTKSWPTGYESALTYRAQVKSSEYLDLSKLTVTAVAHGLPAWLEAQHEARYK